MGFECPHCSQGIDKIVPKDRFDQIYAERKEATAKAEALSAELEELRTKSAGSDGLREQVAELGRRLEAQSSSSDRALAVARSGITDPDDAADLLAIYDRRGGDQPLSEWLGNRAGLPRAAAALFPALPAPGATPEATAAPPAAPPAVQPPVNRGATGHPAGRQAFSAAQIRSLSAAEYRANREAILSSITDR